jgi:hypothetical protein
VLGVQYKGRGLEWFAAEVPDMFDWMNRKKRAHPLTAVGRDSNGQRDGGEFRTHRSTDNRFYWLSVDQIVPQRLNEGSRENWDWSNRLPAMVCASIAEGNSIAVRAHGVRQVSVWLSRGSIDFNKPVVARLNLAVAPGWNGREVKPDLATLLEDFHERGDRQRLYVARLDFRL